MRGTSVFGPFALGEVDGHIPPSRSANPAGWSRSGGRNARAILLAASLLAAVPAGAATTPAKPARAELSNAQKTLSLIVSALNSNDVPAGLKDGLFGCLYENPLKKISAAAAQVWTDNKKLDPQNATAQLLVVAEVCGLPLPKVAGGSKPAKGR